MLRSIKRTIRSGLKGFYRNSLVSFSSVLIIVITMLVLTGLYLSSVILTASIKQLENKVDVNVYFTTRAKEADILGMKKILEEVSEVESVFYVSRDQALEDFKNRNKGKEVILKTLEAIEENPLGANLSIKAKEISKYDEIAQILEDQNSSIKYGNIIENINYYQNKVAIDKLNTMIDYSNRFGLIISVVLVFLSIIITFNTIRLTIYISKNEISVMRLVGASKSFARGPFLVEGFFYGFLGGFLSLLILWPWLYYISPKLNEIFVLNIYSYFIENIFLISSSILGGGILLGVVSSYFAVRKYLQI